MTKQIAHVFDLIGLEAVQRLISLQERPEPEST